MSDNLVKSLSSALAAPSSLQEQRRGQGYFLDDHTPAIPSEGNMLTLLTMKDLFKDGDPEAKAALGAIAKEESKYLMQAMKVLSSETEGAGGESIRRMQDKFGKDMAGATQLAQLLKNESIKQEYEEDIKKFVDSDVFKRNQPGALKPAKVYKGGAQ